MSSDEQILAIFIEETLENLADIEESLLTLNIEILDPEKIDIIFRSAHTIKGGSAIFKMEKLNLLMHTIETFLEPVRSLERKLEKIHVELLMQTSAAIKKTLYDLQNKKQINNEDILILINTFNEIIAESKRIKKGKKNFNIKNIHEDSESITTEVHHWHISIKPLSHIFKKNLDPANAFRMLQDEGKLEVYTITDQLPDFRDFDPLQCFFSWELELISSLSRKEILEILLWIFEEKDITIRQDLSIKNNKKISLFPQERSSSAEKEEIVPRDKTFRISTQKIDSLMDYVGELVIVKSMLKQSVNKLGLNEAHLLQEPLDLLDTNFQFLQSTVLRIRMVPIAFALNRFPSLVFDMANKTGKLINFVIKGDQTEIDKTMIEKLTDPLLHLIRNAIDHGIECPEERIKQGKDKNGQLQLIASQEGDNIAIEIIDDGAGIHPENVRKVAIEKGYINKDINLNKDELFQFLFKPGFSTKKDATEYSGRGVGLDVVEKKVRAMGGNIQLNSIPGKGSHFKIKIPLTLAIMESQLIRVEDKIYIIPLASINEMFQMDQNQIITENNQPYYIHEGKKANIIFLDEILHHKNKKNSSLNDHNHKFAILVYMNEKNYLFVCNELLVQQAIVIKTLEDNFCKVPGIVGATILGDGNLGLILDVQEIINISIHVEEAQHATEKFFFHSLNNIHQMNTDTGIDPKINDLDLTAKEYAIFLLGDSEYAINMNWIKEVSFGKKPTSLPFSPDYLMGIINLRGSIVPVVDLRVFFQISHENIHNENIIIILELEKQGFKKTIGLMVDKIIDTLIIDPKIGNIPKTGHFKLRNYIQTIVYINHRVITVLEIQNILNSES